MPGVTYASQGLSATGEGNSVMFDIYPRGLTITGTSSREYNGTTLAKVSNLAITDGIVPGDPVALEYGLAYGNFVNAAGNRWSHAGKWNIELMTDVSLVNDPNGNYYVATRNITGEILSRPVYLHSLYHDQTTYGLQYDKLAVLLGDGKKITDTVQYNGETLTVQNFYDKILAGTKVDTDTTRYMADQYRNNEEQVKEPNNYRYYDNAMAIFGF